jgi:hypothetical protein
MKALIRDNYRCMITGKVDLRAVLKGLVKDNDRAAGAAGTEAAHILPDSINTGLYLQREVIYY